MRIEDFGTANETQDFRSYEENAAEKFNQLASLNVNDKTESKNGLSYLSWSNAWLEFKKVYPTATYTIQKNPQTGLPYFVDPAVGIMVFTEVTADNLQYSMWLPVLDASNKAMRTEAYTYQVWNKNTKQYESRKVEAATMFDINKALMRCLTKNLSMFGLALYLWSKDDLPEVLDQSAEVANTLSATPSATAKTRKRKAGADRYEGIRQAINSARSTQELKALYQQHENEVKGNPQIMSLFTAKKLELQNVA